MRAKPAICCCVQAAVADAASIVAGFVPGSRIAVVIAEPAVIVVGFIIKVIPIIVSEQSSFIRAFTLMGMG